MSLPTPRDFSAMIDPYLDGVLSGDDLAAFEAELTGNAVLREQVELQRRVEGSLKAFFTPPETVVLSPGLLRKHAQHPAWRQSRQYRILMLAAAAALLLATGLLTYTTLVAPMTRHLSDIRPDTLYARVVDAGFTPEWVCKNDAEFAQSVSYRLGQPLLVASDVPDLQVLGWAYPNKFDGTPLSDQAMILLSRVDGQNVMVVLDRVDSDKPLTVKPSSGVSLFKKQIGNLVAYEVTPRDKPVVIEAMYKPDKPPPDKPREPDPG